MAQDIRIVIAPRGFVFVGEFARDGVLCFVRNGYVVRHWGTTRGLGEIAVSGPTPKTVLDPVPEVELHELTVTSIRCSSRWEELCRPRP